MRISSVTCYLPILAGVFATLIEESKTLQRRIDGENGGENPYNLISGWLPPITQQGTNRAIRISAWGAFVYGATNSVNFVLDQCDKCVAQRRDPQGKCPDSTEGLARNLAITVTGFLWGTGTFGQRRRDENNPSSSSVDLLYWLDSGFTIDSVLIGDDVLAKRGENISDGTTRMVLNLRDVYNATAEVSVTEYDTGYQGKFSVIGDGEYEQGSLLNNTKRNTGPGAGFPLCAGNMQIDLCHNEHWAAYADGNTWYIMDALAKHWVPHGIQPWVQYDGYTAAYYKIYGESDWLMSWRWYFVPEGAKAVWTKCDTGR